MKHQKQVIIRAMHSKISVCRVFFSHDNESYNCII